MPQTVRFDLRVSAPLAEAIRALAEREHRTVNAQLVHLLTQATGTTSPEEDS